jgi:hypothetical protein
MLRSATITSNFTSYGKESLGFYDNVNKIIKWQKIYKYPDGVDDLLDTLNHCGIARTHYPERAFYTAYVLIKEGYDVQVKTD